MHFLRVGTSNDPSKVSWFFTRFPSKFRKKQAGCYSNLAARLRNHHPGMVTKTVHPSESRWLATPKRWISKGP